MSQHYAAEGQYAAPAQNQSGEFPTLLPLLAPPQHIECLQSMLVVARLAGRKVCKLMLVLWGQPSMAASACHCSVHRQ